MDVTGIVVVASEILRFESGNGILLRIHNVLMKASFHLLFVGDFMHLWRKVKVGGCYKFSNLILSAVQLVSGSTIIVFKATEDSLYCEVEDTGVKHFVVPESIKKKLFFPSFGSAVLNHPSYPIISYQGFVTKVESEKLKIYKLDNKVKLYCTFSAYHSSLTSLKEGQEVFVSNSHFFKDQEGNKILVCCGLSSVRVIEEEEEDLIKMECGSVTCSLFLHPLSINDLFWLETFVSRLNLKLQPYFEQSCPFQLESELIDKLLEALIFTTTKSFKRLSLGDEFFSYPHKCSAFSEDILPVRCQTPLIAEVLDSAYYQACWAENSKSWKSKCIPNMTNSVLVGLLFYSKDSWFIKDKSATVPFVLSSSCDECKFESNILCQDHDSDYCCLVVVQNFETIFEKIKKGDRYDSYCYFRTGSCCLFQLKDYFINKNGLCKLLSPKNEESISQIQDLSHKFGNMCIKKGKEIEKIPSAENSRMTENDASNTILILSKIWTVINKSVTNYQVLALILTDETSFLAFRDSSKCLFENSADLYDASDSDLSDLMEGMSLSLKEDILVRLHFESSRECALLLPGHKYEVFDPSLDSYKEFFIFTDKTCSKPPLFKMKSHVKIFHSKACSGLHIDCSTELICDLEEIISSRKVRENSIIRAVLVDKIFEGSMCSGSSSSDDFEKYTLCLVVKDYSTALTMKVYLRSCPSNINGYLPGVCLQLYGFICVLSRRGYLYLTPSSAFGINIVSHNYHPFNESLILSTGHSRNASVGYLCEIKQNISFKCLCYIIKILSARLDLVCNSCMKNIDDSCTCFADYHPSMTVIFLIDDGSCQGVATATEEAAFRVLLLSEKEQFSLTSLVAEEKTPLIYHHKFQNTKRNNSAVNKAFCAYCFSNFICRRVLLQCRKKDGICKGSSQQHVWCEKLLKLSELDLIPELVLKLKQNHSFL